MYPPPPGASPILGLECAGVVTELAPGVSGFARGDRVMALLGGGGYAEEVCVDAGSVMPVPAKLSLVEAAGIPEVFLTCYLNLFQIAAAPRGRLGAGARRGQRHRHGRDPAPARAPGYT